MDKLGSIRNKERSPEESKEAQQTKEDPNKVLLCHTPSAHKL